LPVAIVLFTEIEALAKAVAERTYRAISLSAICRRLNEDEAIAAAYENTFEANAFVLMRAAVDSEFCLSLTRLNERNDHPVESLGALFDAIADNAPGVAAGTLARRMAWVSESEARADVDEHLRELGAARARHNALLASHRWSRAKGYRDVYIAHGAAGRAKVQALKYVYLYELCDETVSIVGAVSSALLGVGEGFEQQRTMWNDYADRLVRGILTGQTTFRARGGVDTPDPP
jgi:hypothetical protein